MLAFGETKSCLVMPSQKQGMPLSWGNWLLEPDCAKSGDFWKARGHVKLLKAPQCFCHKAINSEKLTEKEEKPGTFPLERIETQRITRYFKLFITTSHKLLSPCCNCRCCFHKQQRAPKPLVFIPLVVHLSVSVTSHMWCGRWCQVEDTSVPCLQAHAAVNAIKLVLLLFQWFVSTEVKRFTDYTEAD